MRAAVELRDRSGDLGCQADPSSLFCFDWARENVIDRYETTGKVDWDYLRGLSADAVPTLAALPPEQATCALREAEPDEGGWTGWNLGRARAADALEGFDRPRGVLCSEDDSARE